MKCTTCEAEGNKSRVYESYGVSPLACSYSYYDEDGIYHHHDSTATTLEYSCSNGHKWSIKKYNTCPCGWSGDPKL